MCGANRVSERTRTMLSASSGCESPLCGWRPARWAWSGRQERIRIPSHGGVVQSGFASMNEGRDGTRWPVQRSTGCRCRDRPVVTRGGGCGDPGWWRGQSGGESGDKTAFLCTHAACNMPRRSALPRPWSRRSVLGRSALGRSALGGPCCLPGSLADPEGWRCGSLRTCRGLSHVDRPGVFVWRSMRRVLKRTHGSLHYGILFDAALLDGW